MAAVDANTVEAIGSMLELTIPAQYVAGVAENLERLLLQAKLVMDLELPPHIEPVPVFLP